MSSCGSGVQGRGGEAGAVKKKGGTCGVGCSPGLKADGLGGLGRELGIWF